MFCIPPQHNFKDIKTLLNSSVFLNIKIFLFFTIKYLLKFCNEQIFVIQ